MYTPLQSFPRVSRLKSDIDTFEGQERGCDLEWQDGSISICGLSDGSRTVSTHYEDVRPKLEMMARDESLHWTGHNLVTADWRELERDGIKMPMDPSRVHDTILKFYLTHSYLCKTQSKSALDEDGGERKGRGFMNLGTMLSLLTDLPHYKECTEASHKETVLVDMVNKKGELVKKKRKQEIIDHVCDRPCPLHDPYGYNGIDTIGPMLARKQLDYHMKLKGVEKLYPMHLKLADMLIRMTERGVYVDRKYVDNLRVEFKALKSDLAAQLPFNAASPIALVKFFKERGISLENAQEQTLRDAVEENPDDPLLRLALDYKEVGNGPDRWFGEKYLHGGNLLHPHFNFFTSTGRLMSSNPNIQNVAARRIDRKTGENVGKKIRRALIAPDGYYWVKFDFSQAENRVYMYLAGIEPPDTDFHSWMASVLNLDAKSPFSLSLGGARDAGKSVVHATDYGEGIQLLDPHMLRSPRIQKEVSAGARIVFPDWKFKNRIVTFTGINLANRALGSATFENRKYALEAQNKYFQQFPKIRDLQKRITKECEEAHAVIPPHGYFLLSFGRDEDRIKQALATFGSQPVAHIMKIALLNADNHPKMSPIVTVHDEIGFYVDARHDLKDVKKWIEEVTYFDTPEMPGFRLPGKVSYGKNWADQTKVE